MIRGVVFDLWNTLVVPEGPRFTARLARLLDEPEPTVKEYLRATGCLHSWTTAETMARDLWRFSRDEDAPVGFATKVESEAREFVESVRFISGAHEAISELKGTGVRLGVVSNATTLSLAVVDRIGIRDVIPEIWISCVTGFLKPDPRALVSVASEWGLDPSAMCMVGDKITTDILGARLCSMSCILYSPALQRSQRAMSTSVLAVVNSLDEVPAVVRRQNSVLARD